MARPVGSPNKKNAQLKLDLLATLRENNFDALAELIETHNDAKALYKRRIEREGGCGAVGPLAEARQAATDILEYVYPKLARVEMTGAQGKDLFETFAQIARTALINKNVDES